MTKIYRSKYESFITKEKLSEDMYIHKMTVKQIAEKYKVGQGTIQNLRLLYGLENLNLQSRRVPENLTYEQKQVVLGSSIADAHIFRKNKKRQAAMKFSHSTKQEYLLDYKFNVLKDFVRTSPTIQVGRVKNSVTNYKSFRTLTHPFFTELHNSLYINGKKTLSLDVLNEIDPLGLAIVYMDDGTKKYRIRTFCFECFSFEEQEIFCQYLKDKFNLEARVVLYRKEKNHYRTRVIRQSVDDFVNLIKPYVLKQMYYKL